MLARPRRILGLQKHKQILLPRSYKTPTNHQQQRKMHRTATKSLAAAEFSPLRHRHWINLPSSAGECPPERRLKVLTFNMLNQSYMWPQVYDSYVPREYRAWDYRLKLLRRTITDEAIKSDIMCFQEMEGKTFGTVWEPLLERMGYQGAFIQKGKPGYWRDKDPELIDGVSIFYDTDKFELVESKKVVISKYYEDEFRNWYGAKFNMKQIQTLLSLRNQVGLILVLRHRQTEELITVSNTHLYWKLNDIKLMQTLVLMEALQKMKEKYPMSKVLFAGDFNSAPDSPVYRFLKEDRIETSDPALEDFLVERGRRFLINPVEISSNVFDTIIQQDPDLFTCYTKHLFGIFDYIWYSESQFNLLGFLSGVDRDYLRVIQGLPNRDFPSDHIPLVAEFQIK